MKEKFIPNEPFVTTHYQLESLKQSDTTKKQILETLAAMPEEQLAKSLPGVRLEISKQEVLDRADLILNTKGHVVSDPLIEGLILTHGRPVFLIENGRPVLTGDEIGKWKELIDDAIRRLDLSNAIRSTGRIAINMGKVSPYYGTGWLIADDLIATSGYFGRNLAEKGRDGRYQFRMYEDKVASATIDFLVEYQNEAKAIFDIGECLYLSESDPDVAIFKIKWTDGVNRYYPLLLSDIVPDKGENVAVIGYPGHNLLDKLQDDIKRVYHNIFGVKRLGVGQVTRPESNGFIYDATTQRGCFGAPIYSLQTGDIVGLHYGGSEGYGNFSVASHVLKRIIGEISSKHTHPDDPREWEPQAYPTGSEVIYNGRLYMARCHADADKSPDHYIFDASLKPWVLLDSPANSELPHVSNDGRNTDPETGS